MFAYYWSMVFLIPGILFALWAQSYVKSTFSRFSRVASTSGYTGSKAARTLLDAAGLFQVPVENIQGELTDHYDPRKKVVRLSQATYNSNSVAAIGVVAHEIGHVMQHQQGYFPLLLRNFFVPVAQFGSSFAWIVFFMGLLFSTPLLINFGIWLFVAVVVFSVVTLPVEFNASSRALSMLGSQLMLAPEEQKMAKKVLTAAAMTYVAATLMAILNLLRMLVISRR
ncbi:MAG TPA: zinc metallopeptidase [Thermotogota bacterium]|nr:zinc metallopeptidase [Thermotogota bacterium]HRW91916.1 zinc metallopeptidase [Thermotogota bacterium]